MPCAIIDIDLGMARSFGMADLWRKAVTTLVAEFPGALRDFECAFAEHRFEDLRQYAHHQYGAVIFSGTPMLEKALKSLELACANAPNQVGDRMKELRVAAAALDEFVAAHGIPEIG